MVLPDIARQQPVVKKKRYSALIMVEDCDFYCFVVVVAAAAVLCYQCQPRLAAPYLMIICAGITSSIITDGIISSFLGSVFYLL